MPFAGLPQSSVTVPPPDSEAPHYVFYSLPLIHMIWYREHFIPSCRSPILIMLVKLFLLKATNENPEFCKNFSSEDLRTVVCLGVRKMTFYRFFRSFLWRIRTAVLHYISSTYPLDRSRHRQTTHRLRKEEKYWRCVKITLKGTSLWYDGRGLYII